MFLKLRCTGGRGGPEAFNKGRTLRIIHQLIMIDTYVSLEPALEPVERLHGAVADGVLRPKAGGELLTCTMPD